MELVDIPRGLTNDDAFEYCEKNNIDPQNVKGYPFIFGKLFK